MYPKCKVNKGINIKGRNHVGSFPIFLEMLMFLLRIGMLSANEGMIGQEQLYPKALSPTPGQKGNTLHVNENELTFSLWRSKSESLDGVQLRDQRQETK